MIFRPVEKSQTRDASTADPHDTCHFFLISLFYRVPERVCRTIRLRATLFRLLRSGLRCVLSIYYLIKVGTDYGDLPVWRGHSTLKHESGVWGCRNPHFPRPFPPPAAAAPPLSARSVLLLTRQAATLRASLPLSPTVARLREAPLAR